MVFPRHDFGMNKMIIVQVLTSGKLTV